MVVLPDVGLANVWPTGSHDGGWFYVQYIPTFPTLVALDFAQKVAVPNYLANEAVVDSTEDPALDTRGP